MPYESPTIRVCPWCLGSKGKWIKEASYVTGSFIPCDFCHGTGRVEENEPTFGIGDTPEEALQFAREAVRCDDTLFTPAMSGSPGGIE